MILNYIVAIIIVAGIFMGLVCGTEALISVLTSFLLLPIKLIIWLIKFII